MGLKALATSVQGRHHVKNDLPCQDACKAAPSWIVLADGAGSRRYSALGAKRMVSKVPAILWYLRGKWSHITFRARWKQRLLKAFRNELKLLARKMACDLGDLASTLLAVRVFRKHYLALHLGDGLLGCVHADGRVSVLSRPDNGLFANETWFVTSPDAHLHLRIYQGTLGDILGFFAMSDGAANTLYSPQRGNFAPFVSKLFEAMRSFPEEKVKAWFEGMLKGPIRNHTQDDVSFACFLCKHDNGFSEE